MWCVVATTLLTGRLTRSNSFQSCKTPEAHTWTIFVDEVEHTNEIYFWDAIWLNIITTLTIGYGDMSPSTQYGRVTQVFFSTSFPLLNSKMNPEIVPLSSRSIVFT